MNGRVELSERALEEMKRSYRQVTDDSCKRKAAKVISNAVSAWRELKSERLLAISCGNMDVKDPRIMREAR